MRTSVVLLSGFALLAPSLTLADAASTGAAVRAADEAWSRRTQEVGPATSFPETMDPQDGLIFDAGAPAKGRDAIVALAKKNYPPGSQLTWKVVDAYGSRSGDMGATDGTWTFTAPGIKAIHGRYVTVWRKDASGKWKALMDIGNPDPS